MVPDERVGETRIRVLLADDHELFRQGVKAILTRVPWIEVVGDVANGQQAFEWCSSGENLDVVLMDIHMPVWDGLTATKVIHREFPGIGILMLTASDTEESLFDAIQAGALGYVLKTSSPDHVLESIQRVYRKEPVIPEQLALRILTELAPQRKVSSSASIEPLTQREQDVLRQLSVGASNQQIAKVLFISENTVRNHVRNILEKLHLANRVQAAAYAVREGYTLPPVSSEDS